MPLKQRQGLVTRYYFGEWEAPTSDELVPHGYGHAWIQGGERPCILRGFWWKGHFRYGDKVEIFTATEQSREVGLDFEPFLKFRTGWFYDRHSISYYQLGEVNNSVIECIGSAHFQKNTSKTWTQEKYN